MTVYEYVLIIVMTAYNGSPAVSMQTFYSQKACLFAAGEVNKRFAPVSTVCVPKGQGGAQ